MKRSQHPLDESEIVAYLCEEGFLDPERRAGEVSNLTDPQRARIESFLEMDSEAKVLAAEYRKLCKELHRSGEVLPDFQLGDERERLILEAARNRNVASCRSKLIPFHRFRRPHLAAGLGAAAAALCLLVGIVIYQTKAPHGSETIPVLGHDRDQEVPADFTGGRGIASVGMSPVEMNARRLREHWLHLISDAPADGAWTETRERIESGLGRFDASVMIYGEISSVIWDISAERLDESQLWNDFLALESAIADTASDGIFWINSVLVARHPTWAEEHGVTSKPDNRADDWPRSLDDLAEEARTLRDRVSLQTTSPE